MGVKFARDLIKGKIAELVFQEMFGESDKLTIVPIGYEHTTPILAQYQHHVHIKQVLDNIRNAPDFALITENKEQVYLVEVKYRYRFTKDYILEIANDLRERGWDPSYLFVATNERFYFSPSNKIAMNHGSIEGLSENWIKIDVQQAYLALLQNL